MIQIRANFSIWEGIGVSDLRKSDLKFVPQQPTVIFVAFASATNLATKTVKKFKKLSP